MLACFALFFFGAGARVVDLGDDGVVLAGAGLARFGEQGGGNFSWPDNSFGGGANGKPRSGGGGFGGGWGGRPSGGSGGGGFSRPRTGSSGSRKSGGFKTGGGF